MSETCHYQSCDKEATHRLRYHEPGTPVTYEVTCFEHKNSECIHDPYNITAERIED